VAGFPSYVDYNVGVSYDFGYGLSLAGSIQGANKKRAYNLLARPGVDLFGDGTFVYGQKVQSVNKPTLIVALTKTF